LAQNRMRDMTDDQLTDEVGLGGDIAAVNEMTRRLKVATVESQEAMHHLTTWIALPGRFSGETLRGAPPVDSPGK